MTRGGIRDGRSLLDPNNGRIYENLAALEALINELRVDVDQNSSALEAILEQLDVDQIGFSTGAPANEWESVYGRGGTELGGRTVQDAPITAPSIDLKADSE